MPEAEGLHLHAGHDHGEHREQHNRKLHLELGRLASRVLREPDAKVQDAERQPDHLREGRGVSD